MKKTSFRSENDLVWLLSSDKWMLEVLSAAEKLDLPDWWIGAGFLRNKIWDAIEGIESQPSRDVDLVYFSTKDTAPETDWAYDDKMKIEYPTAQWEVRNQARMHYVNGLPPFTSTSDGIAHWTETATCVAVKTEGGHLKFLFCYGTEDLLGLVARPTPSIVGTDLMKLFHERIEKKKWRERWPDLEIADE